jgi:predicted membrane-bound spermidine synthase
VGRLTALSTLGSFAGTVLIGYLLIPFLPNSITMCLTGLLLMLIAAGYYFVWGKKPGAKFASSIFITIALALGYHELRPKQLERGHMVEIHRSNSNFGLLQVLQSRNGPLRYYLNDYLVQNTYDTNAQQSVSMFTYMLHLLARAYTPRVDDVLCIGLGIGIVPMEFAREGARVDVVEINPAVMPLAQKYFGLRPEKMSVSIGDGRYFVNQSQKQYDTIILDAFLGESSPSHLMTKEAFSAMRRILKPDGTLVINCFGDFDPGEDFFVASLEKTLTNVFPGVRLHNERNGGNVLFVASARTNLTILHEPDFEQVHPHCRSEVKSAFGRIVEAIPEHGIVLTDDYNPVEFYDAANRERIRRNLAQNMRRF